MRTSFVALAGSLLLSACVSGTRVVYVPVPASDTVVVAAAPTPAPRPVEVAPPPVSVTIVQADEGRLLVSLERPSYLAVFDIVPGGGVTLLYPTTARQRQMTLVGARWLDPRWGTLNRYDATSRGRNVRNGSSLMHYVYAVASDRPLRLTDAAFDDALLANALGVRATRVDNPYDTRDAIVRQFVSATRDEDWGEDMYAMDALRSTQTVRVARVYCADGSVMYVRDELADRAYCPQNPSTDRAAWRNRPDSVVAWNGRPVPHSVDPSSRTPVYRIPKTFGGHDIGRTTEGRDSGNSGNNGNNGNHYGWQNGNHGNGNGSSNAGNANGNNGNSSGQTSGNQSGTNVQQQGQPQGNGNAHSNGNGSAQNGGNGNAQNNGNQSNNGNAHGNNDHAQGQPNNAKPESQPAPQPETAPAASPDTNKPPKPKSMSEILKRASGKTPPKKSAPDSSSRKPF